MTTLSHHVFSHVRLYYHPFTYPHSKLFNVTVTFLSDLGFTHRYPHHHIISSICTSFIYHPPSLVL
ncbi:hypothetical protein C8Q75DRAFT_308038 [Abortiporus biennis]|nr:hypothetical protein C8Q75DRAFT_308038 [Abortiporus biennis]